MMKGLILAFHTLTIFRFISKDVKGELSDSLYWFPIVGLFIGLILCSIYWAWKILRLPLFIPAISLLMLLAEILITRAFHMDGLSDWADSFGALNREKRLEIMKDSRVGTFGAIAISMDLACRIIFVIRILELNKIIYILLVPIISRTMMVEMCMGMPYARENGTGAPFVKGAKYPHRAVALFVCGLLSLIYGIKGIFLLFINLAFTFALKWSFKKRFGGVTGDLLGATNEMSTLLSLFIGIIL